MDLSPPTAYRGNWPTAQFQKGCMFYINVITPHASIHIIYF